MTEFHIWEEVTGYKAFVISPCQIRGKGKGDTGIQGDNTCVLNQWKFHRRLVCPFLNI